MATLEKIRSKAGILVAAIIGLALLAFVLGDFLTGKSSFLFTGSKNDVGEISGKSVSIQLLDQKAKELEEIEKLKTGKSTMDDSKSEEVKQNAWQQIIYENVMEKEFDKLGLTVSPDELFDLIQGPNPHAIVRQLFTNPQTGEFNRTMLLQFLKGTNDNPTSEQMAFRLYLEKEIKTDRINNKYINLIRKGLSVPTFLAKNEYIASNKKVDFKYIIQRFNSGSDSSLSITSSDIKKYYNNHKYLYYNQTATRDIDYVSFDVVPSKEDTAGFKEWIYKIKPDFLTETDMEPFVNANSDEQYNDKNYIESDLPDSLGVLMFKEPVGALHGPYFDNGAFKLARLYKIVNIADSVKARHILITPKGNT
jgi:peptidyl-prolyl cis-trans isomerase D